MKKKNDITKIKSWAEFSAGLGKEIWGNIDVDKYIKDGRDSWDNIYMTNNALLIVDVQNDFCHGSYPIPGGDLIIKPINKLIGFFEKNNWLIVASRDWHNTSLFLENPQKAHCVQNTTGAEYHKDLNIDPQVTIISKGSNDIGINHYSAFNGDEIKLNDFLHEKNITNLYIAGLATDYCVKNSAIDSVKNGFNTYVILDACRATKKNPDSEKNAINEMKNAGIEFINSEEIVG